MHRFVFAFTLCFALFIASPLSAQDETEKAPSLQDAQTQDDVNHCLMRERLMTPDIFFAAGEKMLEIATTDQERKYAYDLKIQGGILQATSGGEDAVRKLEEIFEEVVAKGYKDVAEQRRFELFVLEASKRKKSPEGYAAFLAEIKPWIDRKIPIQLLAMYYESNFARGYEVPTEQFFAELLEYVQSAECDLPPTEKMQAAETLKRYIEDEQFSRFRKRAMETEASLESFDAFKSELKMWIDRGYFPPAIGALGLEVARKNGIPAEQLIKELVEYIRSPQCALESDRKFGAVEQLEKMPRLVVGADPKLYGRTLDDKDFDWESLRGKYVLIKFTSTWCGPCKGEIPGMLEAYKKYKDKGLEIVSIYVWEGGSDPVAAVKDSIAGDKLPWFILSETLTMKAGQTGQGDFYVAEGVPTMVLVDKEGKIIMTHARGADLQTKLAEIFGE